jgi:hypothetical protein
MLRSSWRVADFMERAGGRRGAGRAGTLGVVSLLDEAPGRGLSSSRLWPFRS